MPVVKAEPRPLWVTCNRCDNKWTGIAAAHCTGCCQTFTGITAFDKHRTGSHVTGRSCLPPQDAGLVEVTKTYWTGWGSDEQDSRWDKDE